MSLSAYALDNFLAPKLSLLVRCDAPEVPELPNYHGQLVGNQLVVPVYDEPIKVLLLNFLRRLRSATNEYRCGRDYLLQYVSTLPNHRDVGPYFRALAHFEDCVLNGHIAIVCLDGLCEHSRRSGNSMPSVYVQNDDSDYDRLRKLNNRIKHFDEDIEEATKAKSSTAIPVAPMWITDDGLEATTAALSFVELSNILTTHAQDAKSFSGDFFIEAAEWRKQKQAANGEKKTT